MRSKSGSQRGIMNFAGKIIGVLDKIKEMNLFPFHVMLDLFNKEQ